MSRGVADCHPGFLPPPNDPCMRFSRTRLADVLHRLAFSVPVPRAERTRRDDGSVEVDQAVVVRGLAGNSPPSEPAVTPVMVGDEDRQPVHSVQRDRVEGIGGVSVAEVARPAAEEPV